MKLRVVLNFIFSIIFICLFPSCEQEITKSTEKPAAVHRTLYIESIPSGATIFLNGRNMGQTTPDSLTWIEKDTNTVVLRMQYFRDSTFTSVAHAGITTAKLIDFTKNPRMRGGLYIYSDPDSAEIYINDSATGFRTPKEIVNLLPGKYRVCLKYFSCRDKELSALVKSEKVGYVGSYLEDTTNWVTYLPENSGIPDTYFNTIFIETKGIKWLGGAGSGLTRYDEINWTNYNTANSGIPGNQISCLAQDLDNNLWIGTGDGLAIFSGSTFTVYNTNNAPLLSNAITALRKGNDDVMYVGTSKGLMKYSNGQWTAFLNGLLDNEWITDVKIASNGRLIVSTTHGLFLEYGSVWKSFPYFDSMYVSGFLMLYSGRAWVATFSVASSGGLFYVGDNLADPRFVSTFGPPVQIRAFKNEDVSSVLQTSEGEIWVTSNLGVARFFTANSVSRYNVANRTLKSNHARKIIRDANKHYWIVTYGGGLTKFKGP